MRRAIVALFCNVAISATFAALLSLLLILSGVTAVTLLLSAAALVLLFTGGANRWFSRRSTDGSGYPGGYPGYGGDSGGQQGGYGEPEGRNRPW